ncbi:MAG: S-layer homology domain-containing protein [Firmicutes bacterium]|nr:S-layer homology domain-containing protein [Bacillota bacterium]
MKKRFSITLILLCMLMLSVSSLVCGAEYKFLSLERDDVPEVFAGGPLVSLSRGEEAEFWAMLDGEALAYQWWSDDGMIFDSPSISGSSSEVLVLRDVDCADDGKHYWCEITYRGGVIRTEKLELKVTHVYDRPSESAIIKQPTCTEQGRCYVACACGALGEYMLSLDPLGHEDNGIWHHDEEYHWKYCDVCKEIILRGQHKEAETSESCNVCNRVLKTEPEHHHKLSEVPAKAPTCTESGQKLCYQCSCGAIFADPEGKTAVTQYSELCIPATGHCYDRKNTAEEYLQSKADCDHAARYYYSCKCGKKGTESFSFGNKADHTFGPLVRTEEEHYRQCDDCKTIADRSGHCWEKAESDSEYKEIYRCICGAEKTLLSHPFGDVASSDWFYEDVLFAYHRGLLRGVKYDAFGPYAATSRAMIVTILYRLEGEPKTGESPFSDVKLGSWYGAAVTWAADQKLVEGYGNGKFGPDDPVTREQIAAILHRYTVYKKGNVSINASLQGFPDASTVSSWAETPMSWAVAEGLISGVGKGNTAYLCPQDNALRCQIAAILHRYLK